MRNSSPAYISRIISKLRAGQPLSLGDRLRLRLWQHRKHAWYHYEDWSNEKRPEGRVSGGLVWAIRVAFAYGLAGIILLLATPVVGLGFALLLAFLAWIVMGAHWLA